MEYFEIGGFYLDDDLFFVEVFPLCEEEQEQINAEIAMQRLEDVD